VAWLNHPKSVQVCQDRYINGLDQEKPVIPTQKAYWTRTVSRGQPFRDYSNTKVLVFNWSNSKLPVQTFLPCGRKKGLFGHVVAKSRKAWQTMELYPIWISEVHQTYPGHRKSILACRECLGHPISKKNKVKRLFFGWVIPRISFWLQIDYKVAHYKWGKLNHKVNYKLIDHKLIDYKYKWLQMTKIDHTTNWLQMTKIDHTTNWLQVDRQQMRKVDQGSWVG
jgi:hypothetical protein